MNGRKIITTVLAISLVVSAALAQDPAHDEPVRITTELVQTGVVVVDKQGRFVDGLKPEEFLLKVDGRPVTPSFFERVFTGTVREEKLEKSAAAAPPVTPAGAIYRGRTIIFFIDDLHLSAASIQRTRKAILDFVDNEMSIEDQVAVATPSGQLGFLQRFSDQKSVVRAAVGRLNHRPYTVRDMEQIPMTEYQALRIEQGDQSATAYFVTELMKANNITVPQGIGPPSGGPVAARVRGGKTTTGLTGESAQRMVKDRAHLLMRQSESITSGTLNGLESLMRSAGYMPGRKLVFFVSDGFFLNDKSTGYSNKISRIADAAVRGNLVIYSIDARDMGSSIDVSSNRVDPNGQLSRANIGESIASQDGLNALAVDTGGKAFFNTGAVNAAIKEALRETSNYYLLAWRPNSEDQKSPNFKRLEISIPNRPELSVRIARGFFSSEPKPEQIADEASKPAADTAATDTATNVGGALMSALAAPSARTGVPTKLSVSFVDVPGSGPVLTAATQMSTEGLGYGADGKQPAAIDLAGVVLNDQGKQAGSFKTRLNVNPLTPTATAIKDAAVVYSHKLPLKPGIYQVRVAARDDKTGKVGSAAQWIDIPDLGSKKLTLSSLLLGGHISTSVQDKKAGGDEVLFSVDHRFARESTLTFFTIIYNAATTTAPKLDAQIEIQRGGRQRVVMSPVLPVVVEPNSDLARIPYGANVGLKTLAPGRYVLKVTVTDRNANASTTNQVIFDVE
ncbi:MAG TPA: VWA domain-containing protein [Pyrinomonadaceae bacterium]|nr:VWA domain-containing protein [Pyrinomonadaceae bacterium]